MSNTERVEQFVKSWEMRDLAYAMSFFADDAVYHNIPMPVLKGREQIAAFIGQFFDKVDSLSFKTLHTAENADGTVLNERLDVFHLKNGVRIHMPVMGIFEFQNGKIVAWRDYFDMKEYEAQLAARPAPSAA